MTVLWAGDAVGRFKLTPAPPGPSRLLVFIAASFISTTKLRRREGEERIGNVRKVFVLCNEFGVFSWMNPSWILASLWLISRVLKKLALTFYACVFVAFGGRLDFRDLYLLFWKMFLYVFIFSQKEMINYRLTKSIERSPQTIWICYRRQQMHKYIDFIENQDSDHVWEIR